MFMNAKLAPLLHYFVGSKNGMNVLIILLHVRALNSISANDFIS